MKHILWNINYVYKSYTVVSGVLILLSVALYSIFLQGLCPNGWGPYVEAVLWVVAVCVLHIFNTVQLMV
jgi:hypothetical protein